VQLVAKVKRPNQLRIFYIRNQLDMKKPAFTLAFLFPFLLAAQVEFAPVGATWYYNGWAEFPTTLTYFKMEVDGIDTIQGRLCKRITKDGNVPCSINGTSYFYQDGGKVYNFLDGDFHLLYNFDAVAGESWVIPTHNSSFQDSLTVLVDTVYNINIDGHILKVQGLSSDFWWSNIIIEGIGNTQYMFPQVPVCDPVTGGLRCFKTDSLDLHFVSYPCDSVGFSDTKEPLFRIKAFHPNPVFENTVALSTDLEADHVVFHNALGTKASSFQIPVNKTLDLSGLAPGIYFASIFSGLKLVGTDKLVVLKN